MGFDHSEKSKCAQQIAKWVEAHFLRFPNSKGSSRKVFPFLRKVKKVRESERKGDSERKEFGKGRGLQGAKGLHRCPRPQLSRSGKTQVWTAGFSTLHQTQTACDACVVEPLLFSLVLLISFSVEFFLLLPDRTHHAKEPKNCPPFCSLLVTCLPFLSLSLF